MTFDDLVEHRVVGNKRVFIFENHAYALYAWAKGAISSEPPPALLTLDHHTDTRAAFLHYSHNLHPSDDAAANTLRGSLCQQIDKSDLTTITSVIWNLRHDEHIDAAIRSDILAWAFVIQNMDQTGSKSVEQINGQALAAATCECEMSYTTPNNKIFISSGKDTLTGQERAETGSVERRHCDRALETSHLLMKLTILKHMAHSSGTPWIDEYPFILDFDLDYFRTLQSINPADGSLFIDLIRRAQFITIAKETLCVEQLRLAGETITSDTLLSKMLTHIASAA
jgi:hypothetical protein